MFFETLSIFIRDRETVYENIKDEKNLKSYAIVATVSTIVFGALYGAVMGVYAGGVQILFDAMKIPMLLLIALFVSLPTYYVLNGILGGELSLRQMAVLFMVSVTVMAIMMIAFLPVTLFFTLTTPERTFATYAFTVLLNVLFFALAGLTAVSYLLNGFSRIHGENKRWVPAMMIGSLVLAFVGTQLAWVLRPYFHVSWVFLAPPSGNFYIALFELIVRLLGG
ncbi:MAG: hypothetical protein ThorAB25_13940 [Candidatus Thorarchaeota archaeon AB_25]|nr:MAG: hypothetical protein ThorAB25_13940 [Candidatus Thorarchaeota archaeon AB_25]